MAPCFKPGTKVSQMPDDPWGFRTCVSLLQPLKSPMTETRSASGAHTAKATPGPPSVPVVTCDPRWS